MRCGLLGRGKSRYFSRIESLSLGFDTILKRIRKFRNGDVIEPGGPGVFLKEPSHPTFCLSGITQASVFRGVFQSQQILKEPRKVFHKNVNTIYHAKPSAFAEASAWQAKEQRKNKLIISHGYWSAPHTLYQIRYRIRWNGLEVSS